MRFSDKTPHGDQAPKEGSLDEKGLLEKALDCDVIALGKLYDRYASRIFAYICYRVGDETLAEDLTANVFIKMIKAIRASRGWKTSFSAWLYRIAHNIVVDHFRRMDRVQDLPLDERLVAARGSPHEATERTLGVESIGRALGHLTEDQQLVIVHKFFEGYSNREVARMMGKTEGAIKSLQYRALASLRRHLGDSTQYEPSARDRA